ncbi:hypothetical protein [Photobacterium leiognathi]|uniref:hypothetical protein n=1 Tax=Photobacterium leiognathi TaxID=553611 RepID=UPI00273361FF|nr:hypothetical protein [Photobacterium leiognathi]
MNNSSSTTSPYSSLNTSSTNQEPNFIAPQTPTSSPSEVRSHTTDFIILAISMVLTGIIGYFSSLMAVKSDISQNRENISVVTEKLNNALDKIDGTEGDLDKLKSLDKDLALINLKLTHLEKNHTK